MSSPWQVRLSFAFEVVEGPGESIAGGAERWLLGCPYIEERLHALTFRISPAAFFQVNKPPNGLLIAS
jgi:hypothetical protein